MKPAWRIRIAKPGDAEKLQTCMQAAYGVYQERMGGVRLPPMDIDYSSEIDNYPAWVVDSGGVIVGGLIMMFEEDRAVIANIAIDPRCQGQGIGGALMKFAESKARENSYSELQLATHALLGENISLYRHLGWQETARDETRVLMKKTL